jgi:hypothetical protein
MNKTVLLVVALALPMTSFAQGQSLASTIEVYVFPNSGQDASQQSKDESECYDWAVSNSGNDPFDLAKQEEADAQQAQQDVANSQQQVRGSGVRSGVRGAAAGAVVGEIVDDDAGKGAAYGAAAGAVAGRRRTKRANKEAEQQAHQNAEAREEATAEDLDNFKKAFSVCLEAKEYRVKY